MFSQIGKKKFNYRLFLFILLFGSKNGNKVKRESDKEVANVWRKLQKKYNSNLRPNYTGAQTNVNVSINIQQFSNIDDVTMTFKSDLLLVQSWVDYRLQHNLSKVIKPYMGLQHPSDFVWTPDTIFYNMLDGHVHKVTTANHLLNIYQNGTIFWTTRVVVKWRCAFDFKNYPLDSQSCKIGLESYSYDEKHVQYFWNEDIKLVSDSLPQHIISNLSNSRDYVPYSCGNQSVVLTFVMLKMNVVFKRRITVYVIQVFFPCVTLVIVSWLSFWLNANCVSARLGIGIFTLLTVVRLWTTLSRSLPKISYITGLDVYMIICLTFVFLSILEYAFVANSLLALWKKEKLKSVKEAHNIQREVILILTPKSLLVERNSTGETFSLLRRKYNFAKTTKEPETIVLFDNLGRRLKGHKTLQEKKNSFKTDYISMWKYAAREKRPYYYKPYYVTGKPGACDVVSRFLFPFCFLCVNAVFWVIYTQFHLTPVVRY